jgi:2-dehydropantoate 2-reductase
LRILSFGAGAIGTYIGGSLAHQGHRVVFLERPENLLLLQTTGLHLTIEGKTLRIKEPGTAGSLEEALQAGPFDFIIFALKSFDTPEVAELMAPYRERLAPVLCLQNGVENEQILAEAIGVDKVIPGTVTSAVRRDSVGQVTLERLRGVGVGAGHPLSAELVKELNAAGLNARLYARPADMKWSKLLTNLSANASSAILGMDPVEIYQHPDLFRLERAQLREALAVMKAMGLQVVNLPGTPVQALAIAVQRLPESLARRVLARGVGGGRGKKKPSLYIDLHGGRRESEVTALNGAVVRAGERLGIPTPVNRVLTETLIALSQQEEPLEIYLRKPEVLLAKLK